MAKTHWLFGSGPANVLDFKREVDTETDCNACLHREVCDMNMEKRCENYKFGDSRGRSCAGCSHRFTRYDDTAPVPCFSCPWFTAYRPEVP